MRFFQLAFQQTQVSVLDFADQSYPRNIVFNTGTAPLLMQNAQESFARTMAELLVAQQHPLTESFTVQQFMMTTALKELYAFLDVWQVNDNDTISDGPVRLPAQMLCLCRHGTGTDSISKRSTREAPITCTALMPPRRMRRSCSALRIPSVPSQRLHPAHSVLWITRQPQGVGGAVVLAGRLADGDAVSAERLTD